MRTFYPRKTLIIPASEPHEAGASYKVSIGDEDWGDGTFQSVIKVQMMYDGKVAGRMSPSFPITTSDWQRVCEAVQNLTSNGGIHEFSQDTINIPMLLTHNSLMSEFEEILSLVVESPKSEKTRYIGETSNFVSYKTVDVFDFMFYHLCDEVKVFTDYHPDQGMAVCDQMSQRLQELDTDDDTFPQEAIDMLELIKRNQMEKE